MDKLAELCRNRQAECVVAQIKIGHSKKVAQLCRDRTLPMPSTCVEGQVVRLVLASAQEHVGVWLVSILLQINLCVHSLLWGVGGHTVYPQ